jgi:hypothetical protein
MKTLSVVTLIAALAIIVPAQRAQNNTDEKLRARNAPDVFIYSASAFGPDRNGDSNFTIEVGNTCAKAITAIEWEYLSRDYSRYDTGAEAKFRNDKLTLLPDQRRKLTQHVHHYTDKFVVEFHLDTVRITRVEYEDGSSWQRPVHHQ